MSKVIGLGACVYDTLINCDGYPTEDTKLKANGVFVAGGGPVGNALYVMAKLGVNASVLGAFAPDNAGKYLLEDFSSHGVDVSNAVVLKDATSFTSFILISEQNKTRTCVFDRGTVSDDPKNLDYSCVKDASVLHLDGNYLNCAIEAAKIAKENGVKVSLDAGGLYKDIDKLIPYVDILIPSGEFARGFTKTEDIPSAMKILKEKYNPEILVVTDGANGGYYYEDGEIKHYPNFKVKAIDTNGAGDTFHGAFITAYLDGKDLLSCCKFASATSAYKCLRKGVRTFKLDKKTVEDFIENYK